MKVVLIHNNKSGSAKSLRDLKKLLRTHGITVEYNFTVDQKASHKLSTLIKKGVTVAVYGGDGTLNSMARMIAGTKSVLLPLPGGTFNHFVRDVMGTTDLEELLSRVNSFKIRSIDVGRVNGELFLNNSNIGLYPFSLIERKKTKQYIGKWAAAALSAIDQLVIFRRHQLVIDGIKVRSPFVFVGNGKYDVHKAIIPQRTTITDGVLSFMIALSPSRLRLVKTILDVLRGNIRDHDEFSISHRASMSIHSHRSSIPVSFDGEVKRLSFPLEYDVEKGVLRVLCPPPEK